MRSLPFNVLGAVALSLMTAGSASAQVNFGRKPERPIAAPEPSAEIAGTSPVSAGRPSSGRRVNASPNSPLVPGAEVSFSIVEENEPPVRAIVTSTGELEIPGGLGRVEVNGMTTDRAAAKVKSYLEGRYYKPGKATVKIGINFIPEGGEKRSKVIVSGKVLRNGAVEFYASEPKTLSEAVNEAGIGAYSDTKKVKVTRGSTTYEYNVKDILENGNTKKDFPLQDGDRIYVPEVNFRFR